MAEDMQAPVTLIFKAAFGADPLWRRVAGRQNGMVKLGQLPLSDNLKTDVRAWARHHDELQDPPGPIRGTPADLAAWVAAGRDLVARLRTELGPDFDVIDGYQS
ncbi:hypothetical protein OG218_00460 [Kineococcus sp. NBC_00420]|uniref:hypothetical protein n=1 Tax=Kineococcus sp. NBC_00420 TaxID=2903564 RepID=UPI002E1FEF8C